MTFCCSLFHQFIFIMDENQTNTQRKLSAKENDTIRFLMGAVNVATMNFQLNTNPYQTTIYSETNGLCVRVYFLFLFFSSTLMKLLVFWAETMAQLSVFIVIAEPRRHFHCIWIKYSTQTTVTPKFNCICIMHLWWWLVLDTVNRNWLLHFQVFNCSILGIYLSALER